jgi:hypothetical protein
MSESASPPAFTVCFSGARWPSLDELVHRAGGYDKITEEQRRQFDADLARARAVYREDILRLRDEARRHYRPMRGEQWRP